jgi:hypothetical protein
MAVLGGDAAKIDRLRKLFRLAIDEGASDGEALNAIKAVRRLLSEDGREILFRFDGKSDPTPSVTTRSDIWKRRPTGSGFRVWRGT